MLLNGTGTIRRAHAKNYIQKESDARLREVVTTYQNQGLNALGVDSFEVMLYHTYRSVQLCTCQQTTVTPQFSQHLSNTAAVTVHPNTPDKEIVIDYSRPLFGTVQESLYADDTDIEDDLATDNNSQEQGSEVMDSLFSSSTDCAICYKQGCLPSYELIGYDRRVLTTFDIEDVRGYNQDQTTAPHVLRQLDPKGFVEFVVEVPRYLHGLKYAIKNNNLFLVDDVLYDEDYNVLTMHYVRTHAGHSIKIRCNSENFTHVVLEFDVGSDRIRANLAQASRSTDWTLFNTLSNIQIVLPMTIQELTPGDVIYVPSRNTSFKVTDETYLRTSMERNLDWMVSTRVLQPTETLRSIYRTISLG